ncbi:MAG: histidine--tRNA ligase [Candidatus Njordarchaeota archaeon]
MKLPSGFRDLPPKIALIYEDIVEKMKKIFRLYGFEPLYTPHLELWDTLKGKYGDEAENLLIWRFQDIWSKVWYALRYDHTVPLARHFASMSYSLPFKRYTIGNVFRHERAQKGRFREFVQADVDIIGSPNPEADAELINLIVDVMKAIGFGEFKIKISDRRILTGILRQHFDIKDELSVFRAIDKLDKIGKDGVLKELSNFVSRENALRILEISSISGRITGVMKELETKYDNDLTIEGIEHLKQIEKYLNPTTLKYIECSLDLVRGLDYYTGPVWEVLLESIRIGSIGGGGRYDKLLGIYTKNPLPATGTSFGIDRIIEACLELGIYREDLVATKACVIYLSRAVFKYAWDLAYKLRAEGISTEIDLMNRKQAKQREYARKKKIPILIFIGEKEIKQNKITIYHNGQRYEAPFEKARDLIRDLAGVI